MINESSVLKELFLDLEGNKVSEKKDADYMKITTLVGSCGKEKLVEALEGLNVIDALIRDMTGESTNIVSHSLSVFSSVFEAKPEIVKRPETLLRGLISILQSNISLHKASDVNVKALKCMSLICPSLKSLGKEGPAVKSILLQCMVDSENDIAGSAVKLQALILFKSVLQFKLLEFNDTNNWLKILITSIFDENSSIREAALQATNVFKVLLTGNEEYLDILSSNLVPSKFSKLLIDMILHDKNWAVIWRLLVEILGKRLHTSSSLVNSLLAVEEKAFKTSNVETKKEAFKCWNSLLLNFSLEQTVLSSDRRVKLLTIPLRANNCRNGEVALMKLNVWWNIIKLMKSDVSNFSEMVLTPFLCFCYGGVVESMPNGQTRLNSSNSGEACAKLYPVLRVPSLHALCEMLSKSARMPLPASMTADLAVQPLVDPPIVSQKVFSAMSKLLNQCVGEAVNMEGHNAQQIPYIIHCWRSILTLISRGGDEPLYRGDSVSKDLKNISMVKELLRLLAYLVDMAGSTEGKTMPVIVSMIEDLVAGDYAFPPEVLNCHAFGVGKLMVMNSSPSLYLSVLLLAPAFAADKKLHPRIKDLFSKLLKIGCSNVLSPLPFARAILKKMEKDTSEQPSNVMIHYFQELWVLMAHHLSDVIDKEGSVSEGNGAGHDFHCIYGMLMFPISCALKIDQSQESLEPVFKAWGRLFELFVINAQLVVTAQSHETVEELCKKILGIFKKATLSWACLANSIQYIFMMYQKPYFETLWKGSAKKLPKGEKLSGHHHSQQLLILVTSKLVANFSDTSDKNIDDKDVVSKHIRIMEHFILIFSSSSSAGLLNFILEKGIQCTMFYLRLSGDPQQPIQIRNEMVTVWEKFLHFLEKMLPTCTSKAQSVVESLSPLFLEAFGHPLNQIVEHTKTYWNRSLGQYFSSTIIPKSLSEVLDDALKDTSSSEDILGGMVAVDVQKNVFAVPERTRSKSKSKTVVPAKVKESHSNILPPDENVKFQVILPKPKSSVLTEHQKEMMKERRVDIPALYQDLTQDSVSQSFSQESQSVPVLKTGTSVLAEEDANPPFSQNLQPEMNTDTSTKVAEVSQVLTFKLPSLEKPELASKSSAVESSPASDSDAKSGNKEISAHSDTENEEVPPQAASSSSTNNLPEDASTTRRRGRKRKMTQKLKNLQLSSAALKSPKGSRKAEGAEEGAPNVSSDPEKTDKIADIDDAKVAPGKEIGDDVMLSDQPKLQISENNESLPSVPVETCSSKVEADKTTSGKEKAPKDTLTKAPVLKISGSVALGDDVVDSLSSDSAKQTTGTVVLLMPGCDQKPDTGAERGAKKEDGDESSVAEKQASPTSLKATRGSATANDVVDLEDGGKMGLANVRISSPRKISDVEFSSFQAKKSEISGVHSTAAGDGLSVVLGSPKSKSSLPSSKSRMLPASPKSKSVGSSPSLDKWVIVTKRENEEKSPVKSPQKQATLDELVDSSQDPLDSPSVTLKGPVRKCSISLSRVSDILPEEVAFIQYEGRTVKCHMSPRKEESKIDEEARRAISLGPVVTSNVFSPRTMNSRGARMLNLAQGNKEKTGADENPESPVIEAGNKVVLQNSDSNLQSSPLSHLRGCDVNNSTPQAKKPRRIRPVHVGSVSPQYKSSEIGCVASESEVTIHSYSPNASPGGSVMKRKKPAGEDSISPLSKKTRRVSFADPIVSRQVEFCVPESERKFKKRAVHRCLKLADNFSQGILSLGDNDDSGTVSQGKVGSGSSSPCSQKENDVVVENVIEISATPLCKINAAGVAKIPNTPDKDDQNDSVVEVEEPTQKSVGEEVASIVVSDDSEPIKDSGELPAQKTAESTCHVAEKEIPSKAKESNDTRMDVESISQIALVPEDTNSHDDGKREEEALPSSQASVTDDKTVSENLKVAEKVTSTPGSSESKEGSSTDISDNSDKVATSDVHTTGEFSPDLISSSHQSLDSSKTSDSSELSILESDVEEPRTEKLNTQEEAFPPLRDCQDSVSLIIDKLTTKLWKERCKQTLEKRKIYTIGDLSRLMEDVIEKIPFKAPKWKNLTAELKAYHSQISKTNPPAEAISDDQSEAMEVEIGDSDMERFRGMLSRMSAKDLMKELQALNLADALFQEMSDENTSAVSPNAPCTRKQTKSDKLCKSLTPPKTFESTSVQVSEFEVLSELELIAKKRYPVQEKVNCVSIQVSESDLMPSKTGGDEALQSVQPEGSNDLKSTSVQVTESELENFVGSSVQVPKASTSIAVQVSDGDVLSWMESDELLQYVFGRSDFKDAVSNLPQEKLMQLLKLVARNIHEKVQLFDGTVDLIAKRILVCVVKELMKEDGPIDAIKILMWIIHKTLFSKEYIKAIPSILSSVDESVVSELILNQERIMDCLQTKIPAARGLKLAVGILEQKNISLLPEEEIDRLNDILDNHRTCGELFERYTRIVRDRIMGNNISR